MKKNSLLFAMLITFAALNAESESLPEDVRLLLNPSLAQDYFADNAERDTRLLYDRVDAKSPRQRFLYRFGRYPRRYRRARGYSYYGYPSTRPPGQNPCEACPPRQRSYRRYNYYQYPSYRLPEEEPCEQRCIND